MIFTLPRFRSSRPLPVRERCAQRFSATRVVPRARPTEEVDGNSSGKGSPHERLAGTITFEKDRCIRFVRPQAGASPF
jgi:hypothetical protein